MGRSIAARKDRAVLLDMFRGMGYALSYSANESRPIEIYLSDDTQVRFYFSDSGEHLTDIETEAPDGDT